MQAQREFLILLISLLVSITSSAPLQDNHEFQFVFNDGDIDIILPESNQDNEQSNEDEDPIVVSSSQPKQISASPQISNDDFADEIDSSIPLMLPIPQEKMPSNPNDDLSHDIMHSIDLISPAQQSSPQLLKNLSNDKISDNSATDQTRESISTEQSMNQPIDNDKEPGGVISRQPQTMHESSPMVQISTSTHVSSNDNESEELFANQPNEVQTLSNDETGPITIEPFYLILSPIQDELQNNALATLRWTIGSLVSYNMKQHFSQGTGRDFIKISKLEVTSVEYMENDSRRRNRRRLNSGVKVNIASPSFFFEGGGWGGEMPTSSEVENIVQDIITSDNFMGTLQLSSHPQLAEVQSVSFGFSSLQLPSPSPPKIPTVSPTLAPTRIQVEPQEKGKPAGKNIDPPNDPSQITIKETSESPKSPGTEKGTKDKTAKNPTQNLPEEPKVTQEEKTSIDSTALKSPTLAPAKSNLLNPSLIPQLSASPTKIPKTKSTEKSTEKSNEKFTEKSGKDEKSKEKPATNDEVIIGNLREEETLVELQRSKAPIVGSLCGVGILVIFVMFVFSKRGQKEHELTTAGTDLESTDKSKKLFTQDSMCSRMNFSMSKRFKRASREEPKQEFVLQKDMLCSNDSSNQSIPDSAVYRGVRHKEEPKQNCLETSHFKSSDVVCVSENNSNLCEVEFQQDSSWNPDDDKDDGPSDFICCV